MTNDPQAFQQDRLRAMALQLQPRERAAEAALARRPRHRCEVPGQCLACVCRDLEDSPEPDLTARTGDFQDTRPEPPSK